MTHLGATQYMYAEDVTPDGRKTRLIEVRSQRSGDLLGWIKWWGAWRQYVFAPSAGSVFNNGCMDDIQRWIKVLMNDRLATQRKGDSA